MGVGSGAGVPGPKGHPEFRRRQERRECRGGWEGRGEPAGSRACGEPVRFLLGLLFDDVGVSSGRSRAARRRAAPVGPGAPSPGARRGTGARA